MKLLAVFLVISSFTQVSLAKMSGNYGMRTTNGAAGDPDFYSKSILPVLEAVQTGRVIVVDANCNNPSYTNYSNLITATVNGQNHYILLSPGSVNGKNYYESYCSQTIASDNSVQLDCSASEQNPVTSPGASLSFYVVYTPNYDRSGNIVNYNINICPTSAQ